MPDANPSNPPASKPPKEPGIKIPLRSVDEPLIKKPSGYEMTGLDVALDVPIEALFAILIDRLDEPKAVERLTDAKVQFIQANIRVARSIQKNASRTPAPAQA